MVTAPMPKGRGFYRCCNLMVYSPTPSIFLCFISLGREDCLSCSLFICQDSYTRNLLTRPFLVLRTKQDFVCQRLTSDDLVVKEQPTGYHKETRESTTFGPVKAKGFLATGATVNAEPS